MQLHAYHVKCDENLDKVSFHCILLRAIPRVGSVTSSTCHALKRRTTTKRLNTRARTKPRALEARGDDFVFFVVAAGGDHVALAPARVARLLPCVRCGLQAKLNRETHGIVQHPSIRFLHLTQYGTSVASRVSIEHDVVC